jgi:hypothetical protein
VARRFVHRDRVCPDLGCVTGYEQLSREELLGLLAARDRLVEELLARVAELEERLARMERLASLLTATTLAGNECLPALTRETSHWNFSLGR